jgi:hypothetical protein
MTSALDRWTAVGSCNDADAETAGRMAATDAMGGPDPCLLLVFAWDEYDLEALLRGIGGAAPGVPLIGCSTAGEISVAGVQDSSVVVVGLGGTGLKAATSFREGASEDLRAAGAGAAACLRDVPESEHRVLMLLTDGLAGDQQEIVRGAHSVAGGGVPLVGGCAGDGLKMKSTFQMHGDRVLRNAVVGAAISSNAPIGVGVRHGWRRVGDPMLVTSSASNRVFRLDDQPALDLYLDRLKAPDGARSDAAAFTHFAQTHPLGLSRRSVEEHVRFISDANFEDRSLGSIAEVPQGALVWLMEGDDASVLKATDAACADALSSLDGPPIGLIAFDCIARRGVLGDDGIAAEVQRVAASAAGAPVAGFYTYGEIARTRGISGFHNQTLVVLALQ